MRRWGDFWIFTPPMEIQWDAAFLDNLVYFVAAIVFVAAVESLLCSRMADRLADNQGMPYNPNKELWGQGLVNCIAPLLNGFPHTGALTRTATNIKVGGISPLAGILKCFLNLAMAASMARLCGKTECLALHVYANEAVLTYEEDDPTQTTLPEY